MRGGLRKWGRIFLTLLFSIVMYGVGLVIKLINLGNRTRYFRMICRPTRFWAYGVARIWGMRIRISGPQPEAPFFLVSNHLSYTDIILVCAVCPAWFISKSEVARWPGIGALTRVGPTIYIDREIRRDVKRMNHLIADLVTDGGAVGFFPEGTTSEGESVLPFKPSLFQPAVEMTLPVTTAAIAYETGVGMEKPANVIAWVGDDAFAPHAANLLSQPGFTAHIRFGETQVEAEDRKTLAQLSHAQITKDLAALKQSLID